MVGGKSDLIAKVVSAIGIITLIGGEVHAHWPGWLKSSGFDDNSFLGWTDAKAFGTGGSNYMNIGSVVLIVTGVSLLLLGEEIGSPRLFTSSYRPSRSSDLLSPFGFSNSRGVKRVCYCSRDTTHRRKRSRVRVPSAVYMSARRRLFKWAGRVEV